MVHFSADLALVAMVLAGLRRSTGYVLAYEASDLRNYIRRYLGWGEYLFDQLAALAARSAYFRRETALDGFLGGAFRRLEEVAGAEGEGRAHERAAAPRPAHLD